MLALMIELRNRLMLVKRPVNLPSRANSQGYSLLRRTDWENTSDEEEDESELIPKLKKAEDFLQSKQPSIHNCEHINLNLALFHV